MITIRNQGNKCNFCERKSSVFYCNQCKLSFCNDCIEREEHDFYCCSNCNSTKIKSKIKENTLTGYIFICMDCKSTNIRMGKVSKKICPNCKSENILTIIEKRKQLIQVFYNTIKDFKYGYFELNKFIEDCKVHKQELITLRNLGYKHDGKIEQSLLWIYNTTQKVKKEIMDHFQRDFNFIRSRIYRFIDLDTWNPLNFYEIESIINQIKNNVNNFKQYVDSLLKPMIANLRVLKSKISVIQYYKIIFDEYSEDIKLRLNELPVCAFKRINFIKFENSELPSKRGVLFLTNKRMIFIIKKGFLKKIKEELFNIELNIIQNAFIRGKIFKKLKILTDTGAIVLDAPEKILNAIIQYINVSMNFRAYSNDDSYLIQRLGSMDIELTDLKNNIYGYLSQLLKKDIILNNNENIENMVDFSIKNNSFIESKNKPSDIRYNNPVNIPRNNVAPRHIPLFKQNIPNNIPTIPIRPMPQPGTINITIPITQGSGNFRQPFAEVISNSKPNNQNRDLDTINRRIGQSNQEKPFINRVTPKISTMQTRPIIKLYEDKFAIEKTLENIDKLFNNGRITPEVYFKQYRPLQKELFTINKMIDEIKKNGINTPK
ncbi:MAG: hypothetical protein ACTSPY_05610 [Candidatus Helarchaeota archaeon]